MKKIKAFVHAHLYFTCFMLPFLIQGMILLIGSLAGGFTFASNDCYYQYVPFFTSLLNKMKNGSTFFYTNTGGMGFDFYTFACYYLFSPFNILILLFKEDQILYFINFLILLKVSLCALTMSFYLKKTFRNLSDSMLLSGSLCYALSGYVLGYQFNIMWLDGLLLFPLLILSMNELLVKNKKSHYIVLLALTIISNYMMGYMICLYLFLYFFICEFHSIKDFFIKGIRFALSSILSAMISCFVLIPSYLSLSEMKVVKGNTPEFTWIGSFFDELSSFLFLNAPNAITFDREKVNLYCTIFILILTLIYFLSKKIKSKDKLKKAVLILILFISFNNELLNFIWHGFHKQSGIPNRFSFALIFLLITMAAEVLDKGPLSKKQILISGTLVLGFIFLIAYQTDLSPIVWISSAILTVLYMLILINKKRIPVILITLEILVMACLAFCNTGGKCSYGIYTLKEDYALIKEIGYHRLKIQDLDETEEKALNKRVNKLEFSDLFDFDKLITLRNDLKNYGMRNSINESFIYDIPAISMFNTFCNQNLSSFYVKTGCTGSSNTLKMFGDNSVMDMLLGIEATVVKKQETDSLIYTPVFETDHLRLDENQYALPLGYVIEKNVSKESLSQSNPFENMNTITQKIANEVIYQTKYASYSHADCTITSKSNQSFTYETEKKAAVSYEITNLNQDFLYFYYNCSDCSSVELSQNGEIIKVLKLDKRIHKIAIPNNDAPLTLTFNIKSNKNGTCRFYWAEMNEEAYLQTYETLSKQTYQISEFTDGKMKGVITLDEESQLLITIPILKGWSITVDGKPSDYEAFADTYYVLNLEKGTHEIIFTYHTPGLSLGCLISLIGIGCFLLLSYQEKKTTHIKKP